MSNKGIIRLVLLAAVVIAGIVLLVKLITGAFSLLSGLANAALGVVVVIALVLIVIWMFAYASRMNRK